MERGDAGDRVGCRFNRRGPAAGDERARGGPGPRTRMGGRRGGGGARAAGAGRSADAPRVGRGPSVLGVTGARRPARRGPRRRRRTCSSRGAAHVARGALGHRFRTANPGMASRSGSSVEDGRAGQRLEAPRRILGRRALDRRGPGDRRARFSAAARLGRRRRFGAASRRHRPGRTRASPRRSGTEWPGGGDSRRPSPQQGPGRGWPPHCPLPGCARALDDPVHRGAHRRGAPRGARRPRPFPGSAGPPRHRCVPRSPVQALRKRRLRRRGRRAEI